MRNGGRDSFGQEKNEGDQDSAEDQWRIAEDRRPEAAASWLILTERSAQPLDPDAANDRADQRAASADDLEVVLTWLHQSDRTARHTHPRGDLSLPLAGVFATRSPDRPNPIGLHRVTVTAMADGTLEVGALEAIDGTPVVDIKPVMAESADG